MTSPIKPPEGNWWDQPVDRRETIWLGLSTGWAFVLFGWMSAFTRIGDQNPIGESYKVDTEAYRETVAAYKDEAEDTEEGIVPAGDDVYIGAQAFYWDGLPVVLETGREYDFHLGAYDVQHGFSMRPESALSKTVNLQVFPGYEWIVPMEFDDPGTYRVICNEFCGNGHETMNGKVIVRESL